MLSLLDLRGFTGDLRTRLPRPSVAHDAPVDAVRQILADVKARGDVALRELTERFDGVRLTELRVPIADLHAARDTIPVDLRDALERAADGIADFHASERREEATYERDGIVVRTIPIPVDRAGLLRARRSRDLSIDGVDDSGPRSSRGSGRDRVVRPS